MKLRKTLSTLLAAALMCGMLSIPAMAVAPQKVTGGSYYHTVELSDALNEGTAMLGVYGSVDAARPVRIYTVKAGTTLTVTGDHYISVHPVTLLPDGTYEIKSVKQIPTTDGSKKATNDPQYLEESEKWASWTWYVPEYYHDFQDPGHLLPTHVTQTHVSSLVLNNSHAGTWMLQGGEVILKVLPVETVAQNTISVYEVTNRSGLNVRSGAGTNYAKVGLMAYGTRFEVVTASVANGWGQLTNGNWAWLNGAKFIQYKGSCGVVGRQQALWTAANTYRVTAGSLAIHDGPNANHAVVGSVANGQLINVTEYYGEDWGYLADGAGWVNLGTNGSGANVQFAEIKYAANIGDGCKAVDGTGIQARLYVNYAEGIQPIRAGKSANSIVTGYLFNQATGTVADYVDLVVVDNDWGQLANNGGWVYLPTAGKLFFGNEFNTMPSV